MKKVLAIIFLFTCYDAQSQIFIDLHPNPKWDSTKYYSECGLDRYCMFTDGRHYKVLNGGDGVCVYGLQNSLIGIFNRRGFIATKIRNHLVGKPLDQELLDNPEKLAAYLKSKNIFPNERTIKSKTYDVSGMLA